MTYIQKLIIFLCAALAALLYFAPKFPSNDIAEPGQDADFTTEFEKVKNNIPSEHAAFFDKLAQILRQAETDNNEQTWLAAANEFLKAARFFENDNKPVLYKGAIMGFEKTLVLNPDNLSAKTNLGTSIVESSGFLGNQPMKGITLLKEVIEKDSNNIEANLQLGLFSVASRQFDKAIERFHRILRIDSTHIDMHVYLGDTYLTMGEKQKAIESYENYKVRVKDTLIINNIDRYIKELKQPN